MIPSCLAYDSTMDSLPKTHTLTKEEQAFVKKLDPKHQALHQLAVEWLQTSYRPEWAHMFKDKAHS